MTTPKRLTIACAIAATVLMLGGCGKKQVGPYTSKAGSNMPEGKSIDYSNGRGTITEELGPSEESLDSAPLNGENVGSLGFAGDKNSDEYKQTYGRSSMEMQPVYFDFDQATIRGDQIQRIEHNADYLKTNPNQNVLVEGNCDDRGTNEYNLALGERRAQNAKNYLIELGVEEYRIRTISYGEERPLFTGQSDFDFSQNRRDDFILE
ncbi:peptidoglycan-associated lipoprotein Pal [Desulfogranum japonicum]|uniref:peptidoglycan-associated lipoprotein Pal n=1 Tax=Desulfogranum japonicum TaxID=231447 RepID=UPI000423D0FA|nr:peptidoglycan-associated lipoprotein Pal [Desulfogranum japonicum]